MRVTYRRFAAASSHQVDLTVVVQLRLANSDLTSDLDPATPQEAPVRRSDTAQLFVARYILPSCHQPPKACHAGDMSLRPAVRRTLPISSLQSSASELQSAAGGLLSATARPTNTERVQDHVQFDP